MSLETLKVNFTNRFLHQHGSILPDSGIEALQRIVERIYTLEEDTLQFVANAIDVEQLHQMEHAKLIVCMKAGKHPALDILLSKQVCAAPMSTPAYSELDGISFQIDFMDINFYTIMVLGDFLDFVGCPLETSFLRHQLGVSLNDMLEKTGYPFRFVGYHSDRENQAAENIPIKVFQN